MANASKCNVRIFDTTGGILENCQIEAIKYVPGTGTPTASIKSDGVVGGTVLWNTAATTEQNDLVCIKSREGIYVTLGGTGTLLYVYLK